MSKRAAIIQLHRAGHSNSKIMKLLKAPKSTVRDTILRFQELGTMEERDRSGRPRSARTPAKIKALRERIRKNPKRSLRKTAKDMNISHESVRTIVEQDLKMSLYKIRTRQLLTDLQKRKRKERAKILLNRLKGGTEKGEIVFSDEKLFLVEAKFNTQNDRIISNRNIYIVSVNYIFIARQGPVSPYGAHQVQAKMQITIQIRQQRRMIANNNELSNSLLFAIIRLC